MRRGKLVVTILVLLEILCALPNSSSAENNQLSLATLLDRTHGLEWLYSPPLPGEKQIQFSSYDRKSRIENGEKIDWYANADAGNYLGEERVSGGTEYLMADFKGAGYIARIWSANPGKDRWRIYLDGAESPVIDEPGVDLLSGKGRYFKEPFAGKRAMGQVLIFPIPFAKSCKVTLFTASRVKPSRYYQIDIISLPGSKIETFQLSDLEKYRDKIQEVANALERKALSEPANAEEVKFELELEPGDEKHLAELAGPGVIKMLEIKIIQTSLEDSRVALNQSVLSGKFDGLVKPAIYAPLSAFFGETPGVESYNSLCASISWDKANKIATLRSFFPMPFKNSALFSLANYSQKRFKISGKILFEKKEISDDALYFHASYNYLDNYPTRPFSDWTLLDAKGGAGRYVGTMLSVRNPDYIWWGEGDEKIFVDGEYFPSIFGTGTEDYFSYAWGTDYQKFAHAYYGIPVPAHKGAQLMLAPFQALPYRVLIMNERKEEIVSQYRWHILDQIPFHNSIKFDLEIWHWTPSITFDLQAMSYWYGEADVNYNQQTINPKEIPNW